jgi:hypothetical protein
MPDYTPLLNLIPPAIAITVIAYLARFFGKVIEDQNPFADDRKWSIELSGTLFMASMAWGFVGLGFALAHPWGAHSIWAHLGRILVLCFLMGSQYLNNMYEGHRVFNVKSEAVKFIDSNLGEFGKKFASISRHLGISTLSIVLFYIGTLEFISGNLYWITFSFSVIFFLYIFSALNFSYKRLKEITPVEIHFVDNKEKPILNARILKVNDDNIRLRVENKVIILNKNIVSKIEMVIPPNHL